MLLTLLYPHCLFTGLLCCGAVQAQMAVPVILMCCREVTMSALREWAASASSSAHKVGRGAVRLWRWRHVRVWQCWFSAMSGGNIALQGAFQQCKSLFCVMALGWGGAVGMMDWHYCRLIGT
jgi:phosphatidylglycerophosphate synthase